MTGSTPEGAGKKLPDTIETDERFSLPRVVAIGLASAAIMVASAGCSEISPEKQRSMEYPLHESITTTVFWVGEEASADNDFIHNSSSAWNSDWVAAYGGVDDPNDRCGWQSCGFTPTENPFYFALPFGDFTEEGLKSAEELAVVPWYSEELAREGLLLKNRWIVIYYQDKEVYAQWADVGPFETGDAAYVFGDAPPAEPRAGLDISPAAADYLGVEGRGNVDWAFVSGQDVPDGPWLDIVTAAPPKY